MTIPFESMTIDEQKTWWMEQAKDILVQHDMADATISWLTYTHNPVFDVRHHSGHYILRLHQADNSPDVTSEWKVLHHLLEAKLAVPKPILGVWGEKVTAFMMDFLEGEADTPQSITVHKMSAVGRFLARLHSIHKRRIRRLHLNWEGLFGKSGVYYPGDEAMQVFTDAQLAVMDAIAEKVKAVMNELGTSENEFGLIHGDLLLKNILFHEGEVRALDFEYCGWGYYLYDLTPLLWQLKPQARYPELEQALWDGYTSVRQLTSRHRQLLETLIAGRQVASMRWVVANRHNPDYQGKMEGILAQRSAELHGFLETGVLNRQ